MLAHRAQAQAPTRLEEGHLQDDQDGEHQVHEQVGVEQDGPNQRDIGQQRDGHTGEHRRIVEVLNMLQELLRNERGHAGRENVYDRAGDNLVHLVLDGQDAMDERQQGGGKDAGEQPNPGIAREAAKDGGNHTGHQHHAFDGDVDDA